MLSDLARRLSTRNDAVAAAIQRGRLGDGDQPERALAQTGARRDDCTHRTSEEVMTKYVIAAVLGVPVSILAVVYLLSHC